MAGIEGNTGGMGVEGPMPVQRGDQGIGQYIGQSGQSPVEWPETQVMLPGATSVEKPLTEPMPISPVMQASIDGGDLPVQRTEQVSEGEGPLEEPRASAVELPPAVAVERETPDELDDWRDIAQSEGAGNKYRLSKYINEKIDAFPSRLTPPQVQYLYEVRESEEAQRVQALPSETPEQRLEKSRAQRALLRDIRSNAVFPQADEAEAEKFDAVFQRSQTIDDIAINCNLRSVVEEAREHHRRHPEGHMSLEDKFEAGVIALTRAVKKFDPSKGYQLSSYTVSAISKGIERYVGNEDTTIRVPSEAIKSARRVVHDFHEEQGERPTLDQWVAGMLSDNPSMTEKTARAQVQMLSGAMRFLHSLEEPAGTAGETIGETLESTESAPVASFSASTLRSLAQLPAADRRIILLRYEDGLDVLETAERLGVPVTAIQKAERSALNILAVDPTMYALFGARQYSAAAQTEVAVAAVTPTEHEASGETKIRWNPTQAAHKIYRRIFDDPRMSHYETRGEAVADAIAEIQAIDSDRVKTQLLSMLVRNIGKDIHETREQAELQILRAADVEGVNGSLIVGTYVNRVREQQSTDDPTLLLDVGMILANKLPILDDSMRIRVQQSWGRVLRREHHSGPQWERVPVEVGNMIQVIKQREAPNAALMGDFLGERIEDFYAWHPDVLGRDQERYYGVRADASAAMDRLSDQEMTSLTVRLIEEVEIAEGTWDVNRADAADELLGLVDFNRVDIEEVKTAYFAAMRRQPVNADPLSSALKFIEIGERIVPHLPPTRETRDELGAEFKALMQKVPPTLERKALEFLSFRLVNLDILTRWNNDETAKDISVIYGLGQQYIRDVLDQLAGGGVAVAEAQTETRISERERNFLALYGRIPDEQLRELFGMSVSTFTKKIGRAKRRNAIDSEDIDPNTIIQAERERQQRVAAEKETFHQAVLTRGDRGESLGEVGERFGRSEEYVRRLEKRLHAAQEPHADTVEPPEPNDVGEDIQAAVVSLWGPIPKEQIIARIEAMDPRTFRRLVNALTRAGLLPQDEPGSQHGSAVE